MFAAKRAHLGAERFGRRMLRGFGLTPARFDLMKVASDRFGIKQTELWRLLGVVRSAVSEMVAILEELGLVRRRRDELDRRTWLVSLTARGREVFERAHDALVESGEITLRVDAVLAGGMVEVDTVQQRYEYVGSSFGIAAAFGTRIPYYWDLYLWDYEDFYAWFIEQR